MMQLLNGDLLRSIRVLVVDDYEDWRNQVRLVLHFRGTIPIEASRSRPLRKGSSVADRGDQGGRRIAGRSMMGHPCTEKRARIEPNRSRYVSISCTCSRRRSTEHS
jgi:hypothetical protein